MPTAPFKKIPSSKINEGESFWSHWREVLQFSDLWVSLDLTWRICLTCNLKPDVPASRSSDGSIRYGSLGRRACQSKHRFCWHLDTYYETQLVLTTGPSTSKGPSTRKSYTSPKPILELLVPKSFVPNCFVLGPSVIVKVLTSP